MFDESGDNIVRIVGVANGVRSTEQHLEANVWDALSEFAESVPRIFLEEAHRGVEGGSPPHFH